MAALARINKQGRLVIPAECRKAAGLEPGEEVLIEAIGDGELRLLRRREAIRQAQAIVAPYVLKGVNVVDELIAERREEAARE